MKMTIFQDVRGWRFAVRGMLDGNFCGFYNKMTSKSGGGWHRIKAMQPRATADEAQVDLEKRAIEKKWQKVED